MAATNAVLGTYELLEQIITHLPPAQICFARRVSTSWNDIIQRSELVRRSRCMDPIIHPIDAPEYIPQYDPAVRFVYHPFMRAQLDRGRTGYDKVDFCPNGEYPGQSFLIRKTFDPEQFISNPPCSTVLFRGPLELHRASLRVPGGIRVKDYLEARESIVDTLVKYYGEERDRAQGWTRGWVNANQAKADAWDHVRSIYGWQ